MSGRHGRCPWDPVLAEEMKSFKVEGACVANEDSVVNTKLEACS